MASLTPPIALAETPHAFLTPSLPLYTNTLAYLQHCLDPLAAEVSAVQAQRQTEARGKRKRGERVRETDVLRLKRVHTEGFGVAQIWEQARRVIEAARGEAERGLCEAGVREEDEGDGFVDGGSEGEEAEGSGLDLGEEGVDYEVEGAADEDEVYEGNSEEGDEDEDLDAALDGAEGGAVDDYDDDEEDEDVEMDDELEVDGVGSDDANDEPAQELVQDKFGLNDGFFSIDDFNKQSEFLEQTDARGGDDGAASDEEDIDWDADVFATTGALNGAGASGDEGDDNDEHEEDGPTFGDPDAPSEDEDDGVEGGELDGLADMGMGNTNHITYADFFAPPATQKKRKNKKGRPNPHNIPAAAPAQPDDDDMGRTMEAVHRDLFEDEDSAGEEDGDEDETLNIAGPRSADPLTRRSNHERKKAALAEEIRKLEAANVAKRSWTLSGEARAADRPLNSLLEEDLEFERAGKPVPVITAEVSESLEQLIKRRILALDFQDLVRRRPEDLVTGRRGKQEGYELSTQKGGEGKKGLAEEYEDDLLRRTDPAYTSAADEKTAKEEREIIALWNKVRADLDGLSSWHFRPKAPAPSLEVRVDAPAIQHEDARPAAGGEVAGASQLAPQEIYKAGEAVSGREEVAGKNGLPAAREELTGEERKRRRRREKERIRKASGGHDGGGGVGGKEGKGGMGIGKKAREESGVIGELKKGGVKVIGKRGKVTDVAGKEARDGAGGGGGGQKGVGGYKL